MSMNDFFFSELVCFLAYKTQYTDSFLSLLYVIKCI